MGADRNMVEVPMPKRRRAQGKADKSKKSKAAKADPKVLAPAEEDSSVSGRASAQEVTVAIAKSDDDNEDVKDQPKNDKAANSEKPKNDYAANSGKYPEGLTYNPGYCNICQADRALKSPDRSFPMSNGNKWTCGYLQETVQSVNPASDYAPEAQMCVDAKIQAQLGGCECESGNALDLLFDFSSDFLKKDDVESSASDTAVTVTLGLGSLFLLVFAYFLI